MTYFNQLEKKIATSISKINIKSTDKFSLFLQKEFFKKTQKQALIINNSTKEVVFYIHNSITKDNERVKILKELYILISFIEFLIENKYVYQISLKSQRVPFDLIHESFDSPYLDKSNLILNSNEDYLIPSDPNYIFNKNNEVLFRGFLINEFYENISTLLDSVIFPTDKLIELVKHKFQTREKRLMRLQLRMTWIGIITSILLGSYSISSNIQESKNRTMYEDDILNTLKSILDEVNNNYNNPI